MVELIARCGFRCDLCLGYRENVEWDERNRQIFRDGLEKYYGDKLTLQECYCDGCMAEDSSNPVLITKDCRVRSCAISRGLQNCAVCERYPCSDLEKKFVERRKVEARFGGPMPEEDYRLFVMPYEARQVLDNVRQRQGKQ
jgi:hypothetical protein